MREKIVNKTTDTARGRGKLYEEDQFVADVSYPVEESPEIYHGTTLDGSQYEAEGMTSTDGLIEAPAIQMLMGRSLTLHLEDGRRLNGFVTKEVSKGVGFFRGSGGF